MDDTGLGPEEVCSSRAGSPVHMPDASIRGSEPDEVQVGLREGGGDEVGCAIVCADHGKGDATDEEGVGDGVYL